MQVLSARQLNRAVLVRQGLLQRGTDDVATALERMGGLQAQYAPSMYVGLWSRLEGLPRDAVTGALERREAVQGTLLRATIHLVSAGDWWPLALAVREPRRAWYLRVTRGGPTADELEQAARTLRRALADGGPMSRAQVDALIGPSLRGGVGLWLDLVRVPPSGTWERRRADRYAAAEDWLGPPRVDAGQGVDLLVRRYLAAFGPATAASVADWAGLPGAVVGPVLQRVAPRRFQAQDGAELVDLEGGELPDPQVPAPVRFLPTWDATLLVHCRRAGILPEAHRPRIFSTRNPHSSATVLVDGSVAGTWRYEHGRVEVQELTPLASAVHREVRHEAERLAAFHS
jgi:hypothetical protein